MRAVSRSILRGMGFAIAISAGVVSCEKRPLPPSDSADSHSIPTPAPAETRAVAGSELPTQEPPKSQPSVPFAPAGSASAPASVVEVPPDSTAPSQAKRVRITRRADGTELGRAYLDERGQEFRSVRNSEDGLVEISRTFDASGNVVREQVTVNGVDQSELRKSAK
jgi:hypothetical protein